jgi:hypothetical protein
MLLEVIIAGNVMVGPNLCQADFIHKGQLYTIEYKCQENGIHPRENLGTHPSTIYSKP